MRDLPNRRHALAWVLLLLLAGGCSNPVVEVLPNEPPTVRLTQAPIDSLSENFYAYRMHWVGYDPDGRVDYFVYRIDPPMPVRVDATWARTTKFEETIFFSTVDSTREEPDHRWRTTQFHRFGVAAVDNRGAVSEPVYRSFFSYTVAPSVRIVEPRPGSNFTPIVTPSVRISWTGIDPDGIFSTKPVRWKFRLFGRRNTDHPDALLDFVGWATSYPDSFRAMYAPEFRGWQESPAESTTTSYTNLQPEQLYVFVVTGFDEAGAYDPDFSPAQNMLTFEVSFAGTRGPLITVWNEFFNYTYRSGGYARDQSRWILIEVPADQRVTFNWSAEPPRGAAIRSYRWALSGPGCDFDPEDETPRSNELTDWCHWSRRSFNTNSCTVGPFLNNGETWFLYIEAEDNNGLRSLAIVRFTVVRSTFDRDLLFVDDTRLGPDNILPGNVLDPPRGTWPSAAELDTFLFARGNVPWRLYPPRAGGGAQLTTPGIFAGYAFDTVGTRGIPSGVLPLSVLGRYKRVVWYTDDLGATFVEQPLHPGRPVTSLRRLTTAGNPSTFATWIKQGGKAWVMGGGAAYASLIEWNKAGSAKNEYSEADLELIPGRFMFDFAHWRSRIVMLEGSVARRFAPGVEPSWVFRDPSTAPGRGWPGQVPYARLPARLDRRQAGVPDPVPPLRTSANFYAQGTTMEYLDAPNFIIEDTDGDPETPGAISRLDTLYFTYVLGAPRPVMTLYHGREIIGAELPFVFSGFPIWFFKREQILPVVDWVLQDLWGLPREPVSRDPPVPQARARRAPRAAAAP